MSEVPLYAIGTESRVALLFTPKCERSPERAYRGASLAIKCPPP